jgi:hypothetical protein
LLTDARCRYEWVYGLIKTSRESLVRFVQMCSMTVASAILLFAHSTIASKDIRTSYVLLLFIIGGPFVDTLAHTYPGPGTLCYIVSLLFFVIMVADEPAYCYTGVLILLVSGTGVLTSWLGYS